MNGEIEKTAGDLTGYFHFEAYTGGYHCAHCGSWVQWGQYHSCCPQYYLYPNWQITWRPNYNPVLDEIKELLEKILELLSRK